MAAVYEAWAQVGDLQAIRERRVRTLGGPNGSVPAADRHRTCITS